MTRPDKIPTEPVALDLLREALGQWEVELDADPDDIQDGIDFCEASELPAATLRRAVGLVVETWPCDPDNWPRHAMMTGAVEHLAVIVAGIENELISGDPGDGRKLWAAYAGGPYSTEGQAAYAALEACGGMGYMEGLDRFAVEREEVPGDRLDEAQVITDNTGDAPKWIDVDDIGWVLFNQTP